MAELPVSEFIQTRLKEYDSGFEVRKGTAYYDFFVGPQQYMLQPFRDEADEIKLAQSFRRILQQDDPDAFNEEAVDDLASNVFVYRYGGGGSSGVARVYFDKPVAREYPVGGFVAVGSNGLNYTNTAVFAITEAQMSAQYEDGKYYYDIAVTSEDFGEETEIEEDSLVSVVGDDTVTSVTNKNPIKGGRTRETNTKLIERCRSSITVRDLVTGKGFKSIMFETFPDNLIEATAIGFGDKEMMRDVVFNTHIGGKHDGYVKTTSVTTLEKDFYGLLIDTTRAAPTTTQITLSGTTFTSLGETNVDRSLGDPAVREVKAEVEAILTSTVNMALPVDLSSHEWLRITVDSEITKTVRVAGTQPSQTKRSEIATAINNAFGMNICYLYTNTIRLVSPTKGTNSSIEVSDPVAPLGSNSALSALFDAGPYMAMGDGPLVFQEDLHYEVSNSTGQIKRIVGPTLVLKEPASAASISGAGTPTDLVVDTSTGNLFTDVENNDILTIVSGPYAGDYRILDGNVAIDTIQIDAEIDADLDLTNNFTIRRTGIKDSELVYIEYNYNPLSIDIGKYIILDEYGRERGIRPGREANTITDVAFLRVVSIEVIDAVSGEPLGITLNGRGGYGMGGYGMGSYGIGSSSEYRLVVNKPTERFSAFEDAYIVLDSAYQGFSLRVTYEAVPEIEDYHNFVRSDLERVLDGDVLIKHYVPAYVSGTVYYSVDATDSSVPDNESLQDRVKEFINTRPSGIPLELSDVVQFILKNVDPYYRYGGKVRPFSLSAEIHNTDGTTSLISSNDALVIPEEDPFPLNTSKPLSPRISHWIADNILMVRV